MLLILDTFLTIAMYFLDPAPTCGPDGPLIDGQNVNLTCVITYYYKTDAAQTGAALAAAVTATIAWDAAAGTSVYNNATDVYNTAGTQVIGQTLEADVETTASGTGLPLATCTATLTITAPTLANYVFATNTLTYPCIMKATPVTCKHLYVILDNTFNI